MMNKTIEEYFDFGVDIGRELFVEELGSDSLKASIFNIEHATLFLRKMQIALGVILPHQDIIKRGLIMGVKVAGSERRKLTITQPLTLNERKL